MCCITDLHLGEQFWCQMGRWESLEIHVENGYWTMNFINLVMDFMKFLLPFPIG